MELVCFKDDEKLHVIELTEKDLYLLGFALRRFKKNAGIESTINHVNSLLKTIDSMESDY